MSSIIDELILLHKAGIGVKEVLLKATAGNAELIKMNNTGTLEAGKRADLIVVAGDPLKDLSVLRNVAITICNGVVYDWSVTP